MTAIGVDPPRHGPRRSLAGLLASPRFQDWAARFPLTRPFVRRDGERMFDLLAGFCHSQALCAAVELGLLERLLDGPEGTAALARACRVPEPRMAVLLRALAATGLLRETRAGWRPTRLGAALSGVPGLAEMISHDRVLYRDLADPVAFFRGETRTELSQFWPYVFGAGAARDPDQAARYSRLMSETQGLVAGETLRAVSLRGVRRLMDVGGGTGAFLERAGERHPQMLLRLVDLPAVAEGARTRLEAAGMAERAEIVPTSFRDGPLPPGADAISLVRVLYDHADETVAALLARCREALEPGGLLVVSEPMAGAARPERAADGYFALYTLAMGTGRVRSAARIGAMLSEAGFVDVRHRRTHRPFVTGVVTARRGTAD